MQLHKAVLTLGAVILPSVSGGEIETTNVNNYEVLYQNSIELSYDDVFRITSEIPVTSLRYNDHGYLVGGTPIGEMELVVVVSSDCSAEELGGTPIVTYTWDDNKLVSGMDIRLSNETTADVDDLSFLESSVFHANWSYLGYWCSENQNQNQNGATTITKTTKSGNEPEAGKTQTGIQDETMKQERHSENFSAAARQKGLFLSVLALTFGVFLSGGSRPNTSYIFLWMTMALPAILMVYGVEDSNSTSVPTNTTTTGAPICKINVELLHDGCRWSPLSVAAPAARYGNVYLFDETAYTQECTTYYEASMTAKNTTEVNMAHSTGGTPQPPGLPVVLPQIEQDQCYRAVEGRPFFDQSGQSIQAQASNTASGWCSAGIPPKTTTANTSARSALGQEWTRRALGEHASVSSFAAFTIALMSNNAPPALLQDSLTAAADEIRHAQVSFEVASLLMGQTVEPGPLPPSSLKFDHNLTALAIATAQEGCIDETLSAILAAIEVEELWSRPIDGVTESEREYIRNLMSTIALEEASHSALAWRTIQWVCQQDAEACQTVLEQVFHADHLKEAVQKRVQGRPFDSNNRAEKLWEEIHATLIPAVVVGGTTAKERQQLIQDVERESASLTDLLPGKIILGVLGSSNHAASQ